MRIILQRVQSASVLVDQESVGSIEGPGLLALVGVTSSDTPEIAEKLAQKTWKLRILPEEKSCSDLQAPILAVSQFTLYGDARKGRRPSWSQATPATLAEPIFNRYVQALQQEGASVQTGVFGADMKVTLVNDGPFTLWLDSDDVL